MKTALAILIGVLTFVGVVAFWYLVWVFNNWSFNPGLWSCASRWGLAITSIITGLIPGAAAACAIVEHNKKLTS